MLVTPRNLLVLHSSLEVFGGLAMTINSPSPRSILVHLLADRVDQPVVNLGLNIPRDRLILKLPEINIKPWESLKKELEESNHKTKWVEREPYAYWKGNARVSPTRQYLMKCNITDNQD
ncbi:unnamed protein product [Ilex paraguariensis]|uniref:Glycosyl transferase CAP10 domain-containing protein n=1 Tax=Ilex paraguariensis TaxID=185542 RepID=A0ABC8TAH5_9AQUA